MRRLTGIFFIGLTVYLLSGRVGVSDERVETLTKILDAAEEMVQTRGYNAVSFRDLAAAVGIKSASIHYYFQNKGDLGVALVKRYVERFAEARQKIDARGGSAGDRLNRYVKALV